MIITAYTLLDDCSLSFIACNVNINKNFNVGACLAFLCW